MAPAGFLLSFGVRFDIRTLVSQMVCNGCVHIYIYIIPDEWPSFKAHDLERRHSPP